MTFDVHIRPRSGIVMVQFLANDVAVENSVVVSELLFRSFHRGVSRAAVAFDAVNCVVRFGFFFGCDSGLHCVVSHPFRLSSAGWSPIFKLLGVDFVSLLDDAADGESCFCVPRTRGIPARRARSRLTPSSFVTRMRASQSVSPPRGLTASRCSVFCSPLAFSMSTMKLTESLMAGGRTSPRWHQSSLLSGGCP